jgi:hypothetical protein
MRWYDDINMDLEETDFGNYVMTETGTGACLVTRLGIRVLELLTMSMTELVGNIFVVSSAVLQ